NEFTRKHVAEQSHTKRNELGCVFDKVQQQVERSQCNCTNAMRMERRSEQFFDEATRALDLDAVVEHQQQHTQRHTDRYIQVSCRQNTMVVHGITVLGAQACHLENPGKKIHWNQVQGIHEDNPHKDSEGQRRNKAARCFVRNNTFDLVLDHVDYDFDECLEAARNTGIGLASGSPQHQDNNKAHQHRPEDRVKV